MNWYDNLTDDQIHYLKNNKVPLGLCDKWMQEAFELIANHDCRLQCYRLSCWCNFTSSILLNGTVCRLDPYWQRPKPEKKEEDKWKYCDVTVNTTGRYHFYLDGARICSINFSDRENLPGYGGIEFEERPDEWSMTLMFTDAKGVYWSLYEANDNAIPATPKRVRFLRRVEK